MIGAPRAQRELDEAAAAEALQAIAVLPQLAHALLALGEHRDELVLLEQALGVRRVGAHAADAVHDRPEERQVEHGVLDERAHVAVSARSDSIARRTWPVAFILGARDQAGPAHAQVHQHRDVVEQDVLDPEPLELRLVRGAQLFL